jgi:hypothetical protein
MRLVLILIGAGVLATSAAAAGPTFDRTAAGDAAATASLLTAKDLSPQHGWKAVAQGTNSGFDFSCSGYNPSSQGVTEIGAATSADYSTGGVQDVQVLQLSNVYASAAQASTLWSRAVRSGLTRCVAETLESVAHQGIDVRLLSQVPLRVEKVGPMTAGYRVVADLYYPTTKKQLETYFDVILVGRAGTLSEITLSSFRAAVPPEVEYALALIVYDRIG